MDKRSEPRRSERVPYVIVHGHPGLPLIRLVRSPRDLLADSSLRPNALYYITKVIIPPLNRCLNLIGADALLWSVVEVFLNSTRIFYNFFVEGSIKCLGKTPITYRILHLSLSQPYRSILCLNCVQRAENPVWKGYACAAAENLKKPQ